VCDLVLGRAFAERVDRGVLPLAFELRCTHRAVQVVQVVEVAKDRSLRQLRALGDRSGRDFDVAFAEQCKQRIHDLCPVALAAQHAAVG